MDRVFKGQHANEEVLARVEQSGIFWLKLAMRWWWALTFFYVICAFFAGLVFDNPLAIVSLLAVFEISSLLLLIVWHLKQRAQKKIYITTERIIRFNKKEVFSMNLDEIRDIKVQKNYWTSVGEITFNGVSPLTGRHLPDVQNLATYVNEILRLKRAGSQVFPKYQK